MVGDVYDLVYCLLRWCTRFNFAKVLQLYLKLKAKGQSS